MFNDTDTRATLNAASARAKFIADNFPGVPSEFTDAHLGLDPAKWESQGQGMKSQIDAAVKQYNDDVGAERAAANRQAHQAEIDRLKANGMSDGMAAFVGEVKQQLAAAPIGAVEVAASGATQSTNAGSLPAGLEKYASELVLPRA